MKKMKFGVLLIFAVLALVSTVSAFGPGPISFANQGDLVVTYVSSSAGYNNEFGLQQPGPLPLGINNIAVPGTVYTGPPVGRCSKDVILYLTSPTGHTYYSNVPADDTFDHANVVKEEDGSYTVYFENLYGTEHPDWDFNDVVLKVACKPDINSPEFPTLALPVGLIIGMLGVVLFVQRSKEN